MLGTRPKTYPHLIREDLATLAELLESDRKDGLRLDHFKHHTYNLSGVFFQLAAVDRRFSQS